MEFTIERDIYDAKDAEMEQLTMTVADVSNRFDESLGQIEVDDIDGDIDDIENVVLRIKDPMGDVVDEVTIDSDRMPDDWDDYLAESKTPSLLTLGIGAVAVILGWDVLKGGVNKVFNNETQEMLENDPELVESPDTGDLDPAAYEELVVESTGYALDIIPQGLDGSFMGSRFAALPTERYVDYNDPGIGAHTDMAIHRDEIFLEPEMAMVQAAEDGTVVKEAQAPGQSPYNSTTGEENPDFNYRVIKETHPISLDPAVKPFIPQSMAGYTGNANTPPSVMNKMFNIGVLGQTPLFVAGQGDMGSSHTGSRDALPNSLPRVGGIITSVIQTPLSHVNLRAIQDNVPNAYIQDPLSIDSIANLLNNYVYYKAENETFQFREATLEEVNNWYEALRPTEPQIPERDLSITEIMPLDDIEFDMSTAFGAKCSNGKD